MTKELGHDILDEAFGLMDNKATTVRLPRNDFFVRTGHARYGTIRAQHGCRSRSGTGTGRRYNLEHLVQFFRKGDQDATARTAAFDIILGGVVSKRGSLRLLSCGCRLVFFFFKRPEERVFFVVLVIVFDINLVVIIVVVIVVVMVSRLRIAGSDSVMAIGIATHHHHHQRGRVRMAARRAAAMANDAGGMLMIAL